MIKRLGGGAGVFGSRGGCSRSKCLTYLSNYIPIHPPTHLSTYLSIFSPYPTLHPIHLPIRSTYISIVLSIFHPMYQSSYLPIHLIIQLSMCISICIRKPAVGAGFCEAQHDTFTAHGTTTGHTKIYRSICLYIYLSIYRSTY